MEVIRVNATWCSSCIVTYKSWRDLQTMYPNNKYRELDYDSDTKEVNELKVGDILPVHIVFDEYGREQTRLIGEVPKKKLIRELSKYLDK